MNFRQSELQYLLKYLLQYLLKYLLQNLLHFLLQYLCHNSEIQAMRVLIDPVSKIARGVKFRQGFFLFFYFFNFFYKIKKKFKKFMQGGFCWQPTFSSPGVRGMCTLSSPTGKSL